MKENEITQEERVELNNLRDIVSAKWEDQQFRRNITKLKSSIGKVVKNQRGIYGNYATLDAVFDAANPHLEECGFYITQKSSMTEDGISIKTILTDAQTGLSEVTNMAGKVPDLSNMHKLGSCITYLRRYSLLLALNIAPEDDDGNATVPGLPKASQGPLLKPEDYVIPAGKFKGKAIKDVSKDDLLNYCKFMTKDGKPKGWAADFVDNAREYLK